MSITLQQQALLVNAGETVSLSSLWTINAGNLPQYIALLSYDRDRYTSAGDDYATLQGSGAAMELQQASGREDMAQFALFTYTDQGYYSEQFGYLEQMKFTASSMNFRSTAVSMHGFGSAGTEDPTLYATLSRELDAFYAEDDSYALRTYSDGRTELREVHNKGWAYDAGHALGTLNIVTRTDGYHDSSPLQATAQEVAAVARGFIGQDWNVQGCMVLANNISAAAGASLPLSVQSANPDRITVSGNGQWQVAYDSSKVTASVHSDWAAQLRAGDVVVVGTNCLGHVFTIAEGFSYASMVIDNDGAIALDGGANNVNIQLHSLDSILRTVDVDSVVIYRLQAPDVSVAAPLYLTPGASVSLENAFQADGHGHTVQGYQVYSKADGSSFQLNGAAVTAHSAAGALAVSAAELDSLRFQAGSAGNDSVMVRAFDGSYWGDWTKLDVRVGAASGIAPQLALEANTIKVHGGEAKAVASLLGAADPAVAYYEISDPDGGGHLLLHGQALASPANGVHRIAASDFAGLQYAAGTELGGETLQLTAFNAAGLASATRSFVGASVPATLLSTEHFVAAGTTVALSSLFTLLDQGSAAVEFYTIRTNHYMTDAHGQPVDAGGLLNLNGARVIATGSDGSLAIAGADMHLVTFTAAQQLGRETFSVTASTGGLSSILNEVALTTAASGAQVQAVSQVLAAGETVSLDSLLALAPGQVQQTVLRIYDPSGGGKLVLDPGTVNLTALNEMTPGIVTVLAKDLGKVHYQASGAASSEMLTVTAATEPYTVGYTNDEYHFGIETGFNISVIGQSSPPVPAV
jgi:hypothetical protein